MTPCLASQLPFIQYCKDGELFPNLHLATSRSHLTSSETPKSLWSSPCGPIYPETRIAFSEPWPSQSSLEIGLLPPNYIISRSQSAPFFLDPDSSQFFGSTPNTSDCSSAPGQAESSACGLPVGLLWWRWTHLLCPPALPAPGQHDCLVCYCG